MPDPVAARSQMRAASLDAFDAIWLGELRQRQSEKWRHYPPDVLPSFVAEMDFRLAPPISAALTQAISAGDTGYAARSDELTRAFAAFALSRFNWTVDPSDVCLIPDVMVGITEFLRAAAQPGDGVVINTPVYPPFFSHIVEAGCRVVEAPLAQGPNGYELDLDSTERAFQNGARFYLL
ncbi:MAG TPA: aminotransferase class I/II-fold pyridoxal phosphate-dependent enzyme, partial [Candidatus Dormibacteraeota bacterium]